MTRIAGVAFLASVVAAPLAAQGAVQAQPLARAEAVAVPQAQAADTRELVILVHGMGRSPASMWLLGRRLERSGYRVVRFGYRSTRGTVAQVGARLARVAAERAGDAPRVHFVGHSLGTVVIRCMLAHAPPERDGRIVMLAPPNQGAAAADRLARWTAWALPYVRELRTSPGSTARSLELPHGAEVGIIAGAYDRKVRVPETHLPGERDHAVVRGFHTFIMNRADVHRMVVHFLRAGSFSPPRPSGEAA